MLFIILGVLIPIGAAIYLGYKGWKDGELTEFDDYVGGIPLVLGAVLCAEVVAFLLMLSISWYPDEVVVRSGYTPLVSMKDTQNLSGSFFLGCGSINGGLEYTFLKKITTDSGREALKAGNISIHKAVVIETDEEEPKMQFYRWEFKKKIWRLVTLPGMNGRPQVELIVPVGSVMKNVYEVDLQ